MNTHGTDSLLGELRTGEEVSAALRVHRGTLRRWRREGRIIGIRVGRQWLYRPEDVAAFLRLNVQAT
jgi:excisionase family DNA binding protein